MSYLTTRRIYIDMDRTLCDYDRAMTKAREANPEIKYPQSQCDFFRSLPPVEQSINAAKVIKNRYKDVWILTAPSTKNPWSYTEKILWVRDHLGQDWVDRTIICPDKGLLKGDILIDDHPWPSFEGRQIQFGTDEYPDWSSVLDKLKKIIKVSKSFGQG